ncbi:MAG: hypothetical protein HY843_00060 [Bdellovibrio sp.]|nr:hypothetical protein [Bdellovibrio sp.]
MRIMYFLRDQYRYLGIVFFCLGLVVACSKSNKEAENKPNQELIKVPLDLKLKENASLTQEEKTILDSIEKNKTASFKAITNALFEAHYSVFIKDYGPSSDRMQKCENIKSKLKTILEEKYAILENTLASTYADDVLLVTGSTLKSAYEAKIEKELKKEKGEKAEIEYQATYTNIFEFLSEGKMQCYSGTMTYEIARRNQDFIGENTEWKNVIIFESGHVLPGRIEKDDSGNFILKGTETTVINSDRDFGKLVDLNAPIRIVLANDFAVVELFKDFLAKDARAGLLDQALKHAKEIYNDIPLEKLEKLVKSTEINLADAESVDNLKAEMNNTPFGFGKANIPDIPQKRQKKWDQNQVVIIDGVKPEHIFKDDEEIKSCLEIKDLASVRPGFKCKTSKGAVFERVEHETLGMCWKEEDKTVENGKVMIWSKILDGAFTNINIDPETKKPENSNKSVKDEIIIDSPAVRACHGVGGELPAIPELKRLISQFECDANERLTKKGSEDLYKLFPGIKGHVVWSSSVSSYNSDYAYDLDDRYRAISVDGRSSNSGSVLCVMRR